MSLTENLLGLELAILERLRDQIPDIEAASVASLAGSFDITKQLPLIIVSPDESDVGDTQQGRVSVETELWVVALAVEAVPDKRLKEATFEEAGKGLRRIYDAMRGWTPAAGCKPFEYAGRAKPVIDLGWATFPLAFRCGVILR